MPQKLKPILGPDFPSQIAKVIDHIDPHCKAWIERCPFIVIASINAAGAMDTSPKGDPPGFVTQHEQVFTAIERECDKPCDISSPNILALSQRYLSWCRIRGLCVGSVGRER